MGFQDLTCENIRAMSSYTTKAAADKAYADCVGKRGLAAASDPIQAVGSTDMGLKSFVQKQQSRKINTLEIVVGIGIITFTIYCFTK